MAPVKAWSGRDFDQTASTFGIAESTETVDAVFVSDGLRRSTTPVRGRKDDTGKVRMELMAQLSRAYEGVAQVLTWAVTEKKPVPYEPGSWQNVENFYERYLGALKRHLINIERNGPYAVDHETNILDLKHLATDAMFLAEMAQRDIEDSQKAVTSGTHRYISKNYKPVLPPTSSPFPRDRADYSGDKAVG